jgi:tetratricopeptide (TPR) repeat protein
MAEGGIVEGMVGGEADEPDAQVDLGRIDPLAAALAINATEGNPEVAQGVLRYLDDLRALVRLQIKHFDEERCLSIEAAKRKRFTDRIRYGALLGVALLVVGVIWLCGDMVWNAVYASGVVVEAFSVPPDLAAEGLSGQVLATELQDRLNTMQEDTTSTSEQRRVALEGVGTIKVELPETGISLGELNQSLRQWLGQETRVSGEVYRVSGAQGVGDLVLTVRAGDMAGQRWTGAEAGIDALLQSAAEKVYASVAPFRFVDWLKQKGRDADAFALLTQLARHGSAAQMSEADTGLAATSTISSGQSLGYARRAVELDPENAYARLELSEYERTLGHAAAAMTGLLAAARLPLNAGRSAGGRVILAHQIQFGLDVGQGDYQDARRVADADAAFAQDDPAEWSRQNAITRVAIYLHDLAPARQYLQNGYTPNPGISAVTNAHRDAEYRRVAEAFDEETGDWAGALANTIKAEATVKPDSELDLAAYAPMKALALARLGRQAEAEALIATTPADCYECLYTRGRIAARKRDWPTADRWFAEAVRQAPATPFAYYYWGQAGAAKGDLAGAIAAFQLANQTGPHWADPLKAWGDVLARQGQWSAALTQYDAALKYAPAWIELRQARDAARRRTG